MDEVTGRRQPAEPPAASPLGRCLFDDTPQTSQGTVIMTVSNLPLPITAARRPRLAILTACACALLSAGALAADPPPPDGVWVGAAQAGLLESSGNTDASSLNAKLDLAETNGPSKNIFALGGLYSKSDGILSNERIEGRYEYDRKFSDRFFWFGSVDGIRDLFSGFDYQATAAAGVGYTVIDNGATKLGTQVGIGYQRLETQTLVKDSAGEVIQRTNGPAQGDLVGTFGVNLEQKLTTNAKLTDKLLVTSGSLNTAVANDFAVTANVSGSLALSVGYGIRYNTDPAPGVKKLDQVSTVNLVYTIK
jgi:putative salt-induced outer membrane protein